MEILKAKYLSLFSNVLDNHNRKIIIKINIQLKAFYNKYFLDNK